MNERIIKINNIFNTSDLQRIADRKQTDIVFQGYEGTITTFAEPYVEPGMVAVISDTRYPERAGRYFIDKVVGTFGENGGRQQVHIGNSLSR